MQSLRQYSIFTQMKDVNQNQLKFMISLSLATGDSGEISVGQCVNENQTL